MSARTKAHPTSQNVVKVIIEFPNHIKSTSYIPLGNVNQLERFLEKHATEDLEAVDWKNLAKDRIEKYKKAGIVLRGARYRENMSQKQLAEKSKVHQNEISKIENGKRTVGEKVAKRLAKALNIDYKLLIKDISYSILP